MRHIRVLSNDQLVDHIYNFIKISKPMYKTKIVSMILSEFGFRFTVPEKIYIEQRIRSAFNILNEDGRIVYEPRKLVLFNLNAEFPTLRSGYLWA